MYRLPSSTRHGFLRPHFYPQASLTSFPIPAYTRLAELSTMAAVAPFGYEPNRYRLSESMSAPLPLPATHYPPAPPQQFMYPQPPIYDMPIYPHAGPSHMPMPMMPMDMSAPFNGQMGPGGPVMGFAEQNAPRVPMRAPPGYPPVPLLGLSHDEFEYGEEGENGGHSYENSLEVSRPPRLSSACRHHHSIRDHTLSSSALLVM